jgi:MoaA/NifB/PqqE/SkfB family radical SAM enzyme
VPKKFRGYHLDLRAKKNMNESYVSSISLPEYPHWEKLKGKRIPFSFDLEITARCNNNCRHCYINLPSADQEAQKKELTLKEISDLADQAVELGTLWVLITGGEPLLRRDFSDVYLNLKKKGSWSRSLPMPV